MCFVGYMSYSKLAHCLGPTSRMYAYDTCTCSIITVLLSLWHPSAALVWPSVEWTSCYTLETWRVGIDSGVVTYHSWALKGFIYQNLWFMRKQDGLRFFSRASFVSVFSLLSVICFFFLFLYILFLLVLLFFSRVFLLSLVFTLSYSFFYFHPLFFCFLKAQWADVFFFKGE